MTKAPLRSLPFTGNQLWLHFLSITLCKATDWIEIGVSTIQQLRGAALQSTAQAVEKQEPILQLSHVMGPACELEEIAAKCGGPVWCSAGTIPPGMTSKAREKTLAVVFSSTSSFCLPFLPITPWGRANQETRGENEFYFCRVLLPASPSSNPKSQRKSASITSA